MMHTNKFSIDKDISGFEFVDNSRNKPTDLEVRIGSNNAFPSDIK